MPGGQQVNVSDYEDDDTECCCDMHIGNPLQCVVGEWAVCPQAIAQIDQSGYPDRRKQKQLQAEIG